MLSDYFICFMDAFADLPASEEPQLDPDVSLKSEQYFGIEIQSADYANFIKGYTAVRDGNILDLFSESFSVSYKDPFFGHDHFIPYGCEA